MYWRLSNTEYRQNTGSGNKRRLKKLVSDGTVPGIVAYEDGEPVGWCAVGPRSDFVRLENSRILAPIDERPVWSVTCLFIARGHRRQGISVALLKAAVKHVKRHRGRILEGYPTDADSKQPDPWVWTGIASAYRTAGFKEVERRSKSRPIMRYNLAK